MSTPRRPVRALGWDGRFAVSMSATSAANTMRGGRSSYRFFSSDPLTTPSISFGSTVPPNRPGSWNL
jgi:hypothetical protein